MSAPMGKAQGREAARKILDDSRKTNQAGEISYPYVVGALGSLLAANTAPGGKPYPAEFWRGLGEGLDTTSR